MKIIAISGMMGTGKTTLANALARLTGWSVIREDIHNNLFLGSFYENMDRWALASQLSFMLDKTHAFEECLKRGSSEIVLVDRTLHEDFHVFGSILRKYNILTDSEHKLLERFYHLFQRSWRPSDLNIYLEDSDDNCFQRLLDRGDALESKIEIGYVQTVGEEYRNWRETHLKAPYYELRSANLDFREPKQVEEILENVKLLLRLDKYQDSEISARP